MWENAYLSTKNPKAYRTLKWALDPSCKLLASLYLRKCHRRTPKKLRFGGVLHLVSAYLHKVLV